MSSITSYDQTHAMYEEDNTGDGNFVTREVDHYNNDVLIIDMDRNTGSFTQELRSPPPTMPPVCDWIAGLYYLKRDIDPSAGYSFRQQWFPRRPSGCCGVLRPTGPLQGTTGTTSRIPMAIRRPSSISSLRDRSMSAYGQADFKLH